MAHTAKRIENEGSSCCDARERSSWSARLLLSLPAPRPPARRSVERLIHEPAPGEHPPSRPRLRTARWLNPRRRRLAVKPSRSAASACQSAASVSTLIPVPRAMPHDAATLPRWRVSVVPSGQLSPLARTGDPGTRQPNSGLSVPYQASPQLRDGLGGFSSHPFSSDRMDLG